MTDWKRIDAMRDEDIDFSDSPKLGPDFFANAILWPGPKKQITLRIDPDVFTFFRKHGRGYQSTMNAVLRKYMEARKERAAGGRPRAAVRQQASGGEPGIATSRKGREMWATRLNLTPNASPSSCCIFLGRAWRYCRGFRRECCSPIRRAPGRQRSCRRRFLTGSLRRPPQCRGCR